MSWTTILVETTTSHFFSCYNLVHLPIPPPGFGNTWGGEIIESLGHIEDIEEKGKKVVIRMALEGLFEANFL